MSNNPLTQYFRQPFSYISLPSGNRWYTKDDIEVTDSGEFAVYGLTAIDDIMLNTPDAMLNGQALEKVIAHCIPGIKNVKNIMLPDLDAVFVAIKQATTGEGYPMDRICPKCSHENEQDLNCQHLLDSMSLVEDTDCVVNIDKLKVYVKPYTFSMRHLFMQKQFEEQNMINKLTDDLDDFAKGKIVAESVERLSQKTFELVSRSIQKIELPDGTIVDNQEFLTEWLFKITSAQANAVINQVNILNGIGIKKDLTFQCEQCNHVWNETIEFDPVSFFGKRL